MTRTVKRPGAALAVLAGLCLALTACGGSSGATTSDPDGGGRSGVAQDAVVYEFEQAKLDKDDQETLVAIDQSVVVRLSDELKAAIPDGASVVVEQYTVTAKAFPATGLCRLDIDIEYTDSGALGAYASRMGYDTESAVTSLVDFGSPTIVNAVPTDDGLGTEGGYWLTDDYKHAVQVGECTDYPVKSTLEFAYKDVPAWEETDTYTEFAQVEVGASSGSQAGTNNGSVTITLDEATTDADVSVSGTWVKPTD